MSHGPRPTRAALTLAVLVAIGCDDPDPGPETYPPEELGRCADFNPLRNPYFGDTHVHTTLSLDANLQDTRLTPDDAYRFARGEEVEIQPYDPETGRGQPLTLDRPLDFAVVSDHAEFLGALSACNTEGHPGYDHGSCIQYRQNPTSAFVTLNAMLSQSQDSADYPPLCGPGGADCMGAQEVVWSEVLAAAEAAYDRTEACGFTAFVGYEWSANPGARNLHRNVIFRSERVPSLPVSYFDESTPEGLWRGLRQSCLDDPDLGCDVLTIPHNSNLSNGLMFEEVQSDGEPFDADYVAEREAMEPLIEIFQHKGSSECLPSAVNTGDELCSFELLPYLTLADPPLGLRSTPRPASFIRGALAAGLAYGEALGHNPFHYGFIASTDTHLSTPGEVRERSYPGHRGAGGLASESALPDIIEFNPGGLAVLWAEENSREGLFLAMRRREAYGTSGPRIVLRFFGGFGYAQSMCGDHDFARLGYEGGVPMGGTLDSTEGGGAAPTFALWALQDPGTENNPSAPLQRMQVVKGWLDEAGDATVLVYDVAGDPEAGSVDLSSCEPSGDGADSLCSVWTDPDFDPATAAFYYARVLEVPTCRWSQRQCNAAGVDCAAGVIPAGFEDCCLDTWQPTIQERAWSSPIWYEPAR